MQPLPQGSTAREGRAWRDNIYAVIQAGAERQGNNIGIERMCLLAGVSRAGYYRHWLISKPRQEETALRDAIQGLSLVQRKNGYRDGYRPITIQLRRMGWAVNHKRMARIRREDNLLCVPKKSFRPPTTDGRHHWHVWPNLARHLVPMAVNQLWVGANDFVFFGRRGEMICNRREDHEVGMLALDLRQNCVVYVNTLMVQQVLDQPHWAAWQITRDLGAVTPAGDTTVGSTPSSVESLA